MKKILSIFISIGLMFSISACTTNPPEEEVNENQEDSIVVEEELEEEIDEENLLTIEDYYPLKENIIMDYEGIGNEYAEEKIFIEYISENKAQIKIMNPGTNLVKVIEHKDGIVKEIYTEGEFYHIENMLDANPNSEEIILKEPLEVGNSWSTESGHSKEITSIDSTIETPAGTYKALELTTAMDGGAVQKEYFVEGLGPVARIYKDGDFEVKTLLKEILESRENIEVMSYYPSLENEGSEYIKQDIEFATNDKIENILEGIMKNPPNDKLMASISNQTKINRVNLNRNSQVLEIDFSEELLSDMNAGSSLEWEILKSIVNTLGDFYNVENVYITMENEPYESGHYAMMENEYFEVDKEGLNEFKE